ncbi:MAG: thioesterase domain-containing protein, partial [Bacillota bacterium]|nr:thioesterase domain-containing protein [Bacillota bacterium]
EGELWLSGAQVARGYLNRPRLTEEKFIKNPFAAGDIDERIYKTGDLVRWLPSGNLEFIGRIDGQVKIRGFRVETGEIEHEMLQFGGIKEAVVVDMDGQEGSKYLQAFITVKDSPDTGALTAALRRKLPDYMIPEQIMTLDTLPLTQSGKVDRVELRKLTKDHGLRYSAEVIHPKTSTERKMHGIWSELLRLEDISITESFFDAGGDSLMAIRLFLRIKEVFKLDLPASTIYEINTIEQLSGLIDERNTKGVSPCVLIKDGEGGMPLFCIHDFSGEVLAYGRLAHCLEEGRPVYGIRYSSKEDGRTADLESLASDYIRQIKHIQPKGPYHLLGYSAGGAIAYEMALQLAESGEKTATLAFLDTPNYSKYPVAVKNIFYAVAKYGLNWLRALSFKDSIQFIAVNTKAVVRDIFRGLSRNKREEYRTFAVQKSLQRMLSHYVPRYYEGRVTLFRAVKRSIKMDERLGWGGLVKEIEVYETSGNHVSIMNKDNLNIIAEVLRDQYRKDEVL